MLDEFNKKIELRNALLADLRHYSDMIDVVSGLSVGDEEIQKTLHLINQKLLKKKKQLRRLREGKNV